MANTQLLKQLRKLPIHTFKNEAGEKFTIRYNGTNVYIGGKEVEVMVSERDRMADIIHLFNPLFGAWSKEEIGEIGKVLVKISS